MKLGRQRRITHSFVVLDAAGSIKASSYVMHNALKFIADHNERYRTSSDLTLYQAICRYRGRPRKRR